MKLLSKYSLSIFLILVSLIVAYKYEQFVIVENYTIYAITPCDTDSNRCFIAKCEEGDCDETPYKKVEILASIAPNCLKENSCGSFSCFETDAGHCNEYYCSIDTLEDGEDCTEVSSNVPVADETVDIGEGELAPENESGKASTYAISEVISESEDITSPEIAPE